MEPTMNDLLWFHDFEEIKSPDFINMREYNATTSRT